MQLTLDFKETVHTTMLESRERFGGSDAAFAKSIGISSTAFSRLKSGLADGILSDAKWLTVGRKLNVRHNQDNWKIARTHVYQEIEDNLMFCQEFSKAMVLIDDCGIGKTECSKHVVSRLKNAFYFDCSQAKTKIQFIRQLAETVGLDSGGRMAEIKAELKYALNVFDKPLIVLDDAGYLDYSAFLEVQELWNGTEGSCGWYMIGDDSLETKIQRGIRSKKIGYAAIFSRFSNEYLHLVPRGKDPREDYYRELLTQVASVNVKDKVEAMKMVKTCLVKGHSLRYLKTLTQLRG